jgi:hypothetical protein
MSKLSIIGIGIFFVLQCASTETAYSSSLVASFKYVHSHIKSRNLLEQSTAFAINHFSSYYIPIKLFIRETLAVTRCTLEVARMIFAALQEIRTFVLKTHWQNGDSEFGIITENLSNRKSVLQKMWRYSEI